MLGRMSTTATTNNSNKHQHVNDTSSGAAYHTRSRRRVVLAGLAVLGAVAAIGIIASNKSDPTLEAAALQAALDDVVRAGSPGAVVFVRDGDEMIRLASGRGNLEPDTAMDIENPARVGGITKSFTATVVLQLVDDGVIALDDTVEHWLPGVLPNGDGITVRQLLNHTSGLYNYSSDPEVLAPYMEGDLTHPFDPADGVQVAAEHDPLFAPGTALAYSNTNYLLLAMIVEAATGNSFESELTARIFEPLGLDHTSYAMSPEISDPHTHGYIILEGQPPIDATPWNPAQFGASGAILSTADDVAHFYEALLQGELLSADTLASMMTIDPVATGGVPDAGILGGGWGLGVLREDFPCGIAWGHDSETPGYMTAAWNSNDGERQVVAIVNSHFFDHDQPTSEAMRNLLVAAYCAE
jgi:D-alanyl-D-alanine carboxypeptidase